MFRRRITGIDIGSYSVKAVELEAGFRDLELIRFEQAQLPRLGAPAERAAAVRLFLDETGLASELVIAALPPSRVTQRHLRYPFTGAKRVAQAIPFDLEEELPFPLESLLLTHEQALARPEHTDVLVVMTPRVEIGAHLDTLSEMGIEPRVLEIEGAVLANLCSFLDLADTGRLVADIGHSRTNLCLLVDGRPVMLRSIPIAGHHLTEAIAKDLDLSYEAAEEHKHSRGIFEMGSTRPISPGVGSLLKRLTRESLRSVQSVVGDPLDPIAPGEILLVGGSAEIDGLALYFEEETGLPSAALSVTGSESGAEALASAGATTFAQAASLALRGSTSGRITQLDLRREEFAYIPDLSGLRTQLRLAVALFALCLVLWPLSLYSRVLSKAGHVATLQAELQTACSELFPASDCEQDPFGAMENELRATREKANHLGVTGGGLSTLDLMQEISARIPDSLDISLTELKIERRSLQLRGHAKDLRSVGAMAKELRKVDWFQSVPDPSTVQDSRRGGVTFNLAIKLRNGT